MSHRIYDTAIIGGGLAGLTAATDLAKRGYRVIVFESKDYPRHKVCGEFVSNEVLPYLHRLGFDESEHGARRINKLRITSENGQQLPSELPMGAFGLSRYRFDEALAHLAKANGAAVCTQTKIKKVEPARENYVIHDSRDKQWEARVVIGAQGKRSNIDKALQRNFISHRTDYVGVKRHYTGNIDRTLVELYNYEGGYCGISAVEGERVNVCHLVSQKVLNRYRDWREWEEKHLSRNPKLTDALHKLTPAMDKPLFISQINFQPRELVRDGILFCGDSAGLIHPFCGNGMAMAIHGAKLCSEAVHKFLSGELPREAMEKHYQNTWRAEFETRLRFGRTLSPLFGKNKLSEFTLSALKWTPPLFRSALKLSHGKTIY